MNDNIVNFPVSKNNYKLHCPELKEMLRKIVELTESKGIIMISLNNNSELIIARAGDLTTLDMTLMCSYGSYKIMEEFFEGD
jgi:hypothetical protein